MDLPDSLPAPERTRPGLRPAFYLLVAAYAAAILLPFLGSNRTLTTHEVYVALPAKEMLHSGDWIAPRYAGRIWLAKPPLLYWVTASLARLGGEFDEWTARLPAATSAIILSLIITALAARWFDRTTALLAGLIQASSVHAYLQGRLGEIDMPLACLLAGALSILGGHWCRGQFRLPPRSALAFHGLAGLAVLAKGPAAVLLLGAIVIGYCVVRRSVRPLTGLLLTPGLVCFFVVALPWPVALVLRVGDQAWAAWQREYLARFLGTHRLGTQPAPYYLWMAPFLTLPWSVLLLAGARKLWRDARRPEGAAPRFLWTWFLAGLVALTLSAGKHQHYAIPILPPLSILSATVLAEGARKLAHRARPVLGAAFGVVLVVYLAVGAWIMPARDHRRVTADFVRQVTASLPADAELFVAGTGHSAANFYIARPCAFLDSVHDVPRDRPNAWLLAPAYHADEIVPLDSPRIVRREPPHDDLRPGQLLVLVHPLAE